jgi:hypothetical protein
VKNKPDVWNNNDNLHKILVLLYVFVCMFVKLCVL